MDRLNDWPRSGDSDIPPMTHARSLRSAPAAPTIPLVSIRMLDSSDVNKDLGFKAKAKAKDLGSRPRPRPRTWASRPRPRPRTWDSRPRPRPRTWLKSLSQGQGLEEARTKDQGQGHIIGLKMLGSFRKFPGKFPETWKVSTAKFPEVTWKNLENQKERN